MNQYLYVNNNPVNLVDPYGLMGERLEDEFNKPMSREEMMDFVISMSLGPAGSARKAPIVIGETMSRIISKAEAISADYYKARKFPVKIGVEKALKNNYLWFRRMYLQGRELIDEGIDMSRKERSIFYEMERKFKNKWGWK